MMMKIKNALAACLLITTLIGWTSCDGISDRDRWVTEPVIIDPVNSTFAFDKDGVPYAAHHSYELSKTEIRLIWEEALGHTWECVDLLDITKEGTLKAPTDNLKPQLFNYAFEDNKLVEYVKYDDPKANGFYTHKVELDVEHGDFFRSDTIGIKEDGTYEIHKEVLARIISLSETEIGWVMNVVINSGTEYPELLDCIGTPRYCLAGLVRVSDDKLKDWLKNFPTDYSSDH